jgi:hypothetical protein
MLERAGTLHDNVVSGKIRKYLDMTERSKDAEFNLDVPILVSVKGTAAEFLEIAIGMVPT